MLPQSNLPPAPPIVECEAPRPGCDRRTPRIWQEYVAHAQPGDVFRVPFHPVTRVLSTTQVADGTIYLTSEGEYYIPRVFDPGDVGNPCDDPQTGSFEQTTPENEPKQSLAA